MKFYLKQGFVPTYVCAKSQDDTCKEKKDIKIIVRKLGLKTVVL